MSIRYQINAPLTAAQVADVFKSAGLKRPIDDLARIQRMIDNADTTVSAWDGDQLAGIGRAITDYSYCCYLSDLAVRPEYQKKGIGTDLIRRLQEHLGDEVSLLLVSAPSAEDYYSRIGFEKSERAFLVRRKK